jgi:hypothetical protein
MLWALMMKKKKKKKAGFVGLTHCVLLDLQF